MRKNKNYVIYTKSPVSTAIFFSALQKVLSGISFTIYTPINQDPHLSSRYMALEDKDTPSQLKIIILEEKWGVYNNRNQMIDSYYKVISEHSFQANVFMVSPKFLLFINLFRIISINSDLNNFIIQFDIDNFNDNDNNVNFSKMDFVKIIDNCTEIFKDYHSIGYDVTGLKTNNLPFIIMPNLFLQFKNSLNQ